MDKFVERVYSFTYIYGKKVDEFGLGLTIIKIISIKYL